MKDLKELRDQIDVIDRQIVDLYQERMEIAAGVAEYKINTGKKVFDKEREDSKQILINTGSVNCLSRLCR